MRIGLIAGSGQFPIIFCRKARKAGFDIYAAAYHHEADPALADHVNEIEWFYLGQVNRLIKYFKKHQVTQAVMMGGIKKTKLFKNLKPDIKAVSLLAGLRHTHDDGILRAFAGLLEKNGITVRPSTFLLPDLLAPEGCWTRRKPTREEAAEIKLGWKIAKEIGRLDVGQCVVVGGGSILAVEAVDGTDATIRRGGGLGEGNAVVVKVCKPIQDERFDIPATGVETIRTMVEARARVLAIEAGKAVVFDREAMIALADEQGIAILAMTEP
ncbi:MAG: UDP-2,3-diacylglucosamine diphosphatase LpxI [Deltaproteobacteria bacterium]|jgi:UDP-2,3-diacylglucosamine hydrolase|nr:UDP-2,3-diacylglucosamine diphosphatase LpxI [Deltaproteobacteria bacterium]